VDASFVEVWCHGLVVTVIPGVVAKFGKEVECSDVFELDASIEASFQGLFANEGVGVVFMGDYVGYLVYSYRP